MTNSFVDITGTVPDEDTDYFFAEICRICDVSTRMITEMLDEGLLYPPGNAPKTWFFSAIEIKRIHTAIRLQRDLWVNLPGCALVLQLMEELEELRRFYRRR